MEKPPKNPLIQRVILKKRYPATFSLSIKADGSASVDCYKDMVMTFAYSLNATYKTTHYALPLFFLVVPTNVDYQVVGSFVIQNETSQCIREALQIIQRETTGWIPKYFMTDNCKQEITAIEDVFPGKQWESQAPMKNTMITNISLRIASLLKNIVLIIWESEFN